MSFKEVTRSDDGILYMAYYFPQFHYIPENRVNGKLYTDWDFIRANDQHSFTPHMYYRLDNTDPEIFAKQDQLAQKYKIGVFIFYHYWLDNKLIMNLPADMFIREIRQTKFMFLWDNESGFLGKQMYDSAEAHAYQLIRFFSHPNYLTYDDGSKPFIVYLTRPFENEMAYLETFTSFLSKFNIKLRIGYNWMQYKNEFFSPPTADFVSEFAPHHQANQSRGSLADGYSINPSLFTDHWQGAMTSWDSRPRVQSNRTSQKKTFVQHKPNGHVSVTEFKSQIKKIKNNLLPNNKNKIITLFAWNEWSEGGVLESSQEFGSQFLECL